MIEIKIPNSLGFCKKCFRSRKYGSAYCGQCQDEPERMQILQDKKGNFPLTNDVIGSFKLSYTDLQNVVFTFGNVIYCDQDISAGLLAHEITHCFQQMKMGKIKWWKKYLKDDKFRVEQEAEAYRQQYKFYKENDPSYAHIELTRLANDLSGKLYGWAISFQEAVDLITK